ncbi:hypothetical protein NQZ68_032707 [Dissostichus eleginoides]|nr:hypothetical protein NQZ68_032707 [Dissostichus eleginoides]
MREMSSGSQGTTRTTGARHNNKLLKCRTLLVSTIRHREHLSAECISMIPDVSPQKQRLFQRHRTNTSARVLRCAMLAISQPVGQRDTNQPWTLSHAA